jgi:IstB-like ATP binding protein
LSAPPPCRFKIDPGVLLPLPNFWAEGVKGDHHGAGEREAGRQGWAFALSLLRMDLVVLSKPYEHNSVLITTNLSFSEWSRVFGDAKMTTVLLDRFQHSSLAAKSRVKDREQTRKTTKQDVKQAEEAVKDAKEAQPDEPF